METQAMRLWCFDGDVIRFHLRLHVFLPGPEELKAQVAFPDFVRVEGEEVRPRRTRGRDLGFRRTVILADGGYDALIRIVFDLSPDEAGSDVAGDCNGEGLTYGDRDAIPFLHDGHKWRVRRRGWRRVGRGRRGAVAAEKQTEHKA